MSEDLEYLSRTIFGMIYKQQRVVLLSGKRNITGEKKKKR